MTLSAQKISEAKNEARDFLEYSIFVLCQFLGIDPTSATSDMTIPVSEDDVHYWNYVALQRQLQALENLESADAV